ncbi:hypothetical protein SAMN04487900_107121 [Prevotella communis]|uniref:Uncharacterized protein n=2 Tax=Prevotella communis TaxID=2913614 RepID=A0A1H0G5C3_9BACT|nr:hypothetical protein SAMN04487900_107121 [Prevotella communis]
MKECVNCAVRFLFVSIGQQMNNMKIILLLSLLCIVVMANAQKTYVFYTSTSSACPIKIVVNGNAYYLNSGSSKVTLTLIGSNNTFTAYDKYGDQMRVRYFSQDDGSVHVDIGAGHWQASQNRKTDSSQTSTSSSSSNSSSSYGSSDASFGSSVGTAISTWITRGSGGSYSKGYPNFQFNVGLSRAYGEFARLRWYTGGDQGFLLYGGIGKDWLLNGDNKDITSWHIGLGGYSQLRGDYEDIAIGLSMCETPIVKGGALMLDALYSYYFDKGTRFGVFAGGGIGVGNLRSVKTVERKGREHTDWSHAKFLWDVSVGVSLKLWVD